MVVIATQGTSDECYESAKTAWTNLIGVTVSENVVKPVDIETKSILRLPRQLISPSSCMPTRHFP